MNQGNTFFNTQRVIRALTNCFYFVEFWGFFLSHWLAVRLLINCFFFIKPFEYKRIKKLYCCCYSTCIPGNLKREVESYLGLQMPVNSKHILIWFLCFSITFIFFLISKKKKKSWHIIINVQWKIIVCQMKRCQVIWEWIISLCL